MIGLLGGSGSLAAADTADRRELKSRLNLGLQDPRFTGGTPTAARPPLAINLEVDLQVVLTGVLTMLAPENPNFTLSTPAPRVPGVLPAAGINALDRTVIDNHAGWADATSDVTLGAALTLPYAALLLEAADGADWGGLGADALVLTKAYAVNLLVCGLVKQMVRRPRPYMYDPASNAEQRADPDSLRSFFSGHTSWSFTMASAYSSLFTARHPQSPYVLPVWLGSHALAGTTAVMRVLAGKHFWSDVLVGALVGSAVGLAVPWLHRRAAAPTSTAMERFFAELRLVPTFYEQGGFGANALWYW